MLSKKSEEVVENNIEKENTTPKKEKVVTPQEKKVKRTSSKRYKVISVSQYYIIVEDAEGHGIRKNGNFKDVKVGDEISI